MSLDRSRPALFLLLLTLVVGTAFPSSAGDFWIFDGQCKNSTVKMGSPFEDMSKIRPTRIACDAAVLMEMDNGRKIIQFAEKRGTQNTPLGFSGSSYEPQGNMIRLAIDRIYPRRAMGATPEETFAGSMSGAVNNAEGFCFFAARDFRSADGVSCVSKIEDNKTKIIFKIDFAITNVTFKPNMPSR